MNPENTKWLSITILGIAVISAGTFLGYHTIQTNSTAPMENNEPENPLPNNTEATEASQETDSYETIRSAAGEEPETQIFKFNQEQVEFYSNENLTQKEAMNRFRQNNRSDQFIVSAVLFNEKALESEPSKLVIFEFGDRLGYLYQVNKDGKVVSEISEEDLGNILPQADIAPTRLTEAQSGSAQTGS
jgi:hypothetical protein